MLSSGRTQEGSGQFDTMGHKIQTTWDSWRPHQQKSAWGRNPPGFLMPGCEFSPDTDPLAWVGVRVVLSGIGKNISYLIPSPSPRPS